MSSTLSLYNELLGVICLRHKVNSIQHNTTREDFLVSWFGSPMIILILKLSSIKEKLATWERIVEFMDLVYSIKSKLSSNWCEAIK